MGRERELKSDLLKQFEFIIYLTDLIHKETKSLSVLVPLEQEKMSK